jgi:hypothetical protein
MGRMALASRRALSNDGSSQMPRSLVPSTSSGAGGGDTMKRLLSIFLGLAVIALVITMIGLFTRTPQFAELRQGLGRRTRSAMDVLDEGVEVEPIVET